jgi:glucose-1-phosphate adenylyltransferase
VGTLDSYYESNMAFLTENPPLNLSDPEWVIHTQSADRPPVRFEPGARIGRNLIANGCRVAGEVVRSVLFPGVTVATGAVVHDSIVMQDAIIGRGAVVDRAILDKNVRVGDGACVGSGGETIPNRACPDHLASGLTVVGKSASLPDGITLGRNVRIGAHVTRDDFTSDVPSGGVVDGPESMH